MNEENYIWKDRQRAARKQSPQWLSWVGLVIVFAMIGMILWMTLATSDDWAAHTKKQTEAIRQCLNDGRTAINTDHGVSCE